MLVIRVMAIRTTCIGAYPKPAFIRSSSWNESAAASDERTDARGFEYSLSHPEPFSDDLFARATRMAVIDQVECGVDIPTDGEQRRENYIHYHCRHLDGIDFGTLTRKVHRSGAAVADLPTITARIAPRDEHFLDRDFRIAQSFTESPVKITVPGPVTIMDTTADACYGDDRQLAFDLADAINFEIRALADAGCKYVQVDEPLFARNVQAALDYGVACLERCFDGVPDDVVRTMHMCCGYPGHLDDADYEKAPPENYALLAAALDAANIDCISIEDAHRHNNLELLEQFPRSTVILGCVAVAASRLETSDEIASRLESALNHIDRDRLIAAPDCGLTMLGRDLAMQKLRQMCDAARSV